MAGQQPFQFGSAQVGGIDHKVSTVAQGRNHSAFEPNTVRYGSVAGEGVGPTALGIAPLQRFVITIDKQHLEFAAGPADNHIERFEHALDSKAASAQIDADGNRPRVGGNALDQSGGERERQVVEGFVAHIFECLQRRRPPCPRHSGHQEHTSRRRASGGAPLGVTTFGHHRRIIASTESAESARKAKRNFAAVEASNGDSAIDGTASPSTPSQRVSGKRSTSADGTRSTNNASVASATASSGIIPAPRTSIRPAIAAGAVTETRSPARRSSTWSSAARRAPASISRRARSDFPAPDGPRSRTARPSIATAVAWTRMGAAGTVIVTQQPRVSWRTGRQWWCPPHFCGFPPRSGGDEPRRSVSRSKGQARNVSRIARRVGARCRSGRKSPSIFLRGYRVPDLRR